jgi:putative PIN family toxin of toxin-antitoxin system
VVLDTNVIISGTLTAHGACARILDSLFGGAFEFCADDRVLSECDSVLLRPEFRIAAQDVETMMQLLRRVAVPVAAPPLPVELSDPDDLPFLEVAAAADAILVTGNARHFPKKACKGVTVVSPKEFLELLRRLA